MGAAGAFGIRSPIPMINNRTPAVKLFEITKWLEKTAEK